jgi:mannose-6-phosphate isomerase
MWYVADAQPGASLHVGLNKGVTRADFEQAIQNGTVADCVHRVPVQAGDVMFLPSGRLHAIGAGLVIFEIQQNSDTTYRVFDWNRTGLDGKPRELHVAQSLASIDFNDFEPAPIGSIYSRNPTLKVRFLVDQPLFTVNACQVKRGGRFYVRGTTPQIIGLLRGRLVLSYAGQDLRLAPGQFALLPACLERTALTAETQVEFLQAEPGSAL